MRPTPKAFASRLAPLLAVRPGESVKSKHSNARTISNVKCLDATPFFQGILPRPILEHPMTTFDKTLRGNLEAKVFVGTVKGQTVAIAVAKEGAYKGKVVTAVILKSQ